MKEELEKEINNSSHWKQKHDELQIQNLKKNEESQIQNSNIKTKINSKKEKDLNMIFEDIDEEIQKIQTLQEPEELNKTLPKKIEEEVPKSLSLMSSLSEKNSESNTKNMANNNR